MRRAATPRVTIAKSGTGKEGPTTIPMPAVRNGGRGFDGQSIRRPCRRSALAERMACHRFSFRKEVIQPQVLLRLPCYDFTPIMNYTLDGCFSCELAHRLLVQPTFVM